MADRSLVPLGPVQLAVTSAAFLALIVLVTLGSSSGDEGPTGIPMIVQYGPALLRAVFILIVILEAAVILLVIWALWPDGEKRGKPRARRSWWAVLLATFVQLATGVAFLWYLRERRRGAPALGAGGALSGLPDLKPIPLSAAIPSGTEWLTAVLVLGVLALVGWRLWRTFGLGRRSLDAMLAEDLAVALDQSIEELESDLDPRHAVISAYGRMTKALAGGGLPRLAHETALEYLSRVLGSLHVPEQPVRRLTELFQFAKFSPHEVDLGMKADALAALREIREGLPVAPAPARAKAAARAGGAG